MKPMNAHPTLTLTAGSSRIDVKPDAGGAIVAWTFDGVSLLRPVSDEMLARNSARKLGCFPLVPYSNRIAHATLTFAGTDYALTPDPQGESHAIHGNGWYSPWTVQSREKDRLSLVLTHDAGGASARDWPFPFEARETFHLSANGLDISLALVNRGSRPMPCGLGVHPYFRRGKGCTMQFSTGSVWLNGPDKLVVDKTSVPGAWSFVEARSPDDAEMDNCFEGWDGRARIAWPEDRLALTMNASEIFRHLVVFTPQSQDFFCIEPVSHANGAIDRAAQRPELGARILEPEQTLSGTVRFQIEKLA
jgi:aldose 1-epimerase